MPVIEDLQFVALQIEDVLSLPIQYHQAHQMVRRLRGRR